MNFSFDSYRIFYYAAKYQGFTQAAQILGSNQPNITRAIKKLEAALGCKLFVRSNQGARLTPEGEKLYAHIALAFGHIQAGEAEIAANQSLQSGVVTVAASEVALHCFLLPVLKAYRARYPGVRIRVTNYTALQAIEVIKDGLADFAVITTPQRLPKTLRHHILMEIQEVPIAGTAFAELCGKPLTLRELARCPLVGLEAHTATFGLYSKLFSEQGLTFQPDIEVATADQILPMVKNDLGIGFVPESMVRDDIAAGNVMVLSLETPVPKRSICLLRQEDQPLSITARELKRMVTASGQ